MIVSAFHINGVEIDKDFNGDQITLLVVGIPTKKRPKKNRYVIGFFYFKFSGSCGEKNGHGAPLQNKFIN